MPTKFRGGDLTAFMGGCSIDLRAASIPPGEAAVLDVLALMGGVEVFVPPTWVVETPVVAFLAGIEDHRGPSPQAFVDGSSPAPARLLIKGFMMMSGIHLRT